MEEVHPVATSQSDVESEDPDHDAPQARHETTANEEVDSTSREEKVDLAARRAAILASLDELGPLPSGV